jgi:HAD superfamily hydrolase (TIGR01509 family)
MMKQPADQAAFVSSPTNFPAVCFDLDGVIALTEPLKAKAHIRTVETCGGKAALDDYLTLMGKSHEAVRAGMIERSGITVEFPVYSNTFRQIYHDLVESELVVRPGAVELGRALRSKGFRLAVVSSSTAAMVRQVLGKAGLLGALDVMIAADDVSHKKPHPEPYLLAMKKLGAKPDSCVIFEDSASGLKAGLDAGCRVIAVRHSLNQDQAFEKAALILDSFDHTSEIVRMVTGLLQKNR